MWLRENGKTLWGCADRTVSLYRLYKWAELSLSLPLPLPLPLLSEVNCRAECSISPDDIQSYHVLDLSFDIDFVFNQQYNKIADKIEVSHVLCAQHPIELVLIADYQRWGQFNKYVLYS